MKYSQTSLVVGAVREVEIKPGKSMTTFRLFLNREIHIWTASVVIDDWCQQSMSNLWITVWEL